MSRNLPSRLTQYPWATTRPFIVGAPMRIMAGPALAVAVSRAGGLGFIGPGAKTQDVAADLEEASRLVVAVGGKRQEGTEVGGKDEDDQARHSRHSRHSHSHSHSHSQSAAAAAAAAPHPPLAPPASSSDSRLPVGVGFQLWTDDAAVAADTIARFRPCAAWLFAPREEGPRELDDWARRIRRASPTTQVWVQIGTLREAKQLLLGSEAPDAVVVQGAEAGGHGRAYDGMGLMALLPEVADAMAGSHIPLLAAGGIADGRGVAAALCLGASGAVMGTRFLASSEARIRRGYQDEIVRASDSAASTTRTQLYNHLRGTFGWPAQYSPRTIVNRSFVEHQAGTPFEELKKRHDEAQKMGDAGWGPEGRLATYAGAAIGLIHGVRDAGDIVREVQRDALERLRLLSAGSGE